MTDLFAVVWPLSLKGPEFLAFYFILFLACWILGSVLQTQLGFAFIFCGTGIAKLLWALSIGRGNVQLLIYAIFIGSLIILGNGGTRGGGGGGGSSYVFFSGCGSGCGGGCSSCSSCGGCGGGCGGCS